MIFNSYLKIYYLINVFLGDDGDFHGRQVQCRDVARELGQVYEVKEAALKFINQTDLKCFQSF